MDMGKNGLPRSVSLDKHTTEKLTANPWIQNKFNNRMSLSQFERALKELREEPLRAHSPQAKGRTKRLFRTLPDRLLKEMRLRESRIIEENNWFLNTSLPLNNKRISACPREDRLHRPFTKGLHLNRISNKFYVPSGLGDICPEEFEEFSMRQISLHEAS